MNKSEIYRLSRFKILDDLFYGLLCLILLITMCLTKSLPLILGGSVFGIISLYFFGRYILNIRKCKKIFLELSLDGIYLMKLGLIKWDEISKIYFDSSGTTESGYSAVMVLIKKDPQNTKITIDISQLSIEQNQLHKVISKYFYVK